MAVTGKPSIDDSRIGDRKAQLAIQNIRERIEQVEAALNLVQSQAATSSNSGAQTIAVLTSLQAQITALKASVAALTIGPDVTFTASTPIAIGDAVYSSGPTTVAVVDPTDPFAAFGVVGLATTAGAVGGNVVVRRFGTLLIGGTAFDVGRAVYAAPGGGLTQAPPSYASVAIPVAVANGVSSVYIQPGWAALLAESFDPGFDEFLPVTLARMRDEFAANVNNAIVEIFDDTTLDIGVRLCIVNAASQDIIVTLPSGFIDGGNQTREITIYRRDQSSGGGGPTAVMIQTESGQSIENFYPATLADRELRSFLATGAPGWIQVGP
jgi:hypothetical protein